MEDLLIEFGAARGVILREPDGARRAVRARAVIGAAGAQSPVARRLGLEGNPEEHHCTAVRVYFKGVKGLSSHLELHYLPRILPGYFWIFPLEGGLANVGVGMVSSAMKARGMNLHQEVFELIREEPLLKDRFAGAEPAGPLKGWTLPFGSWRRRCHGAGWLLAGDAASLVDPFSGEGIGNAMLSGSLAADVLDRALAEDDLSERRLGEYESRLWGELGPELRVSARLQGLAKGFKPLLNYAIARAASSPRARDYIAGTLLNEHAKRELASPLFYLRLLFS